MHKLDKYVLLFSISLFLLLSISSVGAVDDCSAFAVSDGAVSSDGELFILSQDLEDTSLFQNRNTYDVVSSAEVSEDSGVVVSYDEDELIEGDVFHSGSSSKSYKSLSSDDASSSCVSVNDAFYIDADNFNDFFEGNVLKSEYGNVTLVFNGTFDDFGVLKFYSNGTRVTAVDSLFHNTVFDLGASGIVLSNINLVLDKEFEDNEYSGVLVHADNVTVYNCTINYTTPVNVTAFGIYSNGHYEDYSGLNIINNTINLYGYALGADDYNYGIILRETHDSLVYGNNIYCELPIKYINYAFHGAYGSASMDTVAALLADYCDNLTLSSNNIHTFVNGGDRNYPTLDTVVLYGCGFCVIEDNAVLCEDFYTPSGYDNYLYALDLHRLNDVSIVSNNVSVFTNGGTSGMGTAYPIQINGPVDRVKIAYNRLTTFNHGPNCGIYSQNFYGDTFIDIISNFINVTGDASNNFTNPSWCLVSGIEVQDTGDNILNNTIIVNNLGDYKSSNNVYGISYVQNTGGGHTYNIQYNNITTNGNYGVRLIGNVKDSETYNSTISNNVINTMTSSNRTGASTNRQVDGPSGTTIKNNTNGNLKNVMSDDDLPDWLNDIRRPVIPSFDWINRVLNPNSNGTGYSDAVGNGTASWGSGNSTGLGNGGSGDGRVSGNGFDSDSANILGDGLNSSSGFISGDSNSTSSVPGFSGDALASSSAASASDVGSSAMDPDAYEVLEPDNVFVKSTDYLQLAIICIVALGLILIGYKRQKDKEEEE